MNRCPITYEECGDSKYSDRGLKRLSRNLTYLSDLPYSAEEQIKEAAARADKMSIQGVQPKLSAVLSPKKSGFEIVDRGGRYILKPQVPAYFQVPENEDLTMRLAANIGIEVPLHGLVYSKDGSMTYFVMRFDRSHPVRPRECRRRSHPYRQPSHLLSQPQEPDHSVRGSDL